MASSDVFGTNTASSSNGGLLPQSLLESATLSTPLNDNSDITDLQRGLRSPSGSDPISSGLASLDKSDPAATSNSSKSNQDFSTNPSSSVDYTNDYSPLFKQEQNFTYVSPKSTKFDSTTSFDPLTGNAANTPLVNASVKQNVNPIKTLSAALSSTQSSQPQSSQPQSSQTQSILAQSSQTQSSQTQSSQFQSSQSQSSQSPTPNFAIRTEGTISINGGDFDGNPKDLSDDALIYAAKGFTINNNPILPVQIDSAGNPIHDSSGKLVLVDKAVAVSSGYTVTNGPSNQYAGLIPPQVIPQQTVTVPAYTDVKQQELGKRIPSGTPTVTFNTQQNPINNANDWANKFPHPGTATNPTVVLVTGGGLNIPANINLNNYVITVDSGDLNFNGNGHTFNNVVLVANNGNINLSDVQSRDLSVLASGSINMNSSARFAGSTLLANGSNGGSITG